MPQYIVKLNDLIIDSEQVHIVSKIEDDRIFYCPLIKDSNKGQSCSSIPLSNFYKANLRPVLTKKEIKNFLETIPTEKPLEIPDFTNRNNNSNSLKEVLYLNDPIKTARLLIYFNNLSKESPLSRFDQLIFDQALTHLAQEVSVVTDTPIASAKKQILSAIKK